MNRYVVVEGATCEMVVYPSWIAAINPKLVRVDYAYQLAENNYYILSGGGFPQYLDIVRNSVRDIIDNGLNAMLVVCIDSEDLSLDEKYAEVAGVIRSELKNDNLLYKIIVQHFCLETWLLGNRKAGPRTPKSEILKQYKKHFDVMARDPKDLTSLTPESHNRSQFAERYLRLMLNDKNRNVTYSKRQPNFVANPKYYEELVKRFSETGHISSFSEFGKAFA